MKQFEKCVMAVCVAMMAASVQAADPSPGGSALTMGSGTNETHVTAQRADYDISKNILVLDGNVVVKDPRVTITADQITMTMTTNREPETIWAVGHVVIEQELNPAAAAGKNGPAIKGFRRAVCGKAVDGVSTGLTILTEKPVITQEGMSLNGSRIIYSRDQDKVHIDNSSGVFIPSEGKSTGFGDMMKPKKPASQSKE